MTTTDDEPGNPIGKDSNDTPDLDRPAEFLRTDGFKGCSEQDVIGRFPADESVAMNFAKKIPSDPTSREL